MRFVTVSTVTKALPIPGEPVGGTSCDPVRVAVSTIWSAFAEPNNIKTANRRLTRLSVFFIVFPLFSFEPLFDSLNSY